MNLPPQLAEVIEQARTAVRADLSHTLSPYFRQQIYDAFALQPKGREVRSRLEIMTARKVAPFWQEVWPERLLPHHLVQQATDVLEGTAHSEAVRAEANDAWVEQEKLETQTSDDREARAFYATQATIEAVFYVTGLDRWEGVEIGAHENDADLDPWSSDTALYAAAAYSGAPWNETSNHDRRLEFWLWWLSEAISEAWQETHTSPNDQR